MIDRKHELAVGRQAALLQLSHSSLYYEPRAVSPAILALMRRIDELHLNYPFAGSRMLRDMLRADGVTVGRELVAQLMRRMGIEAIYRRPNTSKPAAGHKIYPYLLRKLVIDRPNQVWATDITYIPMARGFVYLTAVVDWFTQRVLAWRLSITMEADFCIEAVEEALARNDKPEIFNTDQGSQFTSLPFTGLLLKRGIAISMNGRGAWRDNVFVERLWRSVKYEEVYLRAYESVAEAGPRSAGIWLSITAADPIPALTRRRRTKPTSTMCRYRRQHDFSVVAWALLRSGYALSPRRPGYYGDPINRQKLYL